MASPAKMPEPTSQCAQCQQPVATSGMQRHLDWQCPAAQVSCGECDGSYTRGTLPKHLQYDCKNTASECPFAPYGCKAKIGKASSESVKKSQFEDHMTAAVDTHYVMLSQAYAMLVDYRKALQKQIDARDFELQYLGKECSQLTKQLSVAKSTRADLTTQLAEYEKQIATFTNYMTAKIKADPSLAPGPAAADKKSASATAAAGTAAAGGSGGADAKDHKDAKSAPGGGADKSLQAFADDKRGAEALIVHYKPRSATAPALVDLLPKLKSATTSITSFGRVTLTDVTNIQLITSFPVSEYRSFAERKIAAEYIAAYYSVRSHSVTDEAAATQLMEEQRVNGALIWALTCAQPVPADVPHADANAMDELGLDFAKVLADPKRIAVAFDRIVTRGILNDDVMSMWMTCAFLGRWSLARELTTRAKEIAPDALELNHFTAQQNHNIPDMSLIMPLTGDGDTKATMPDADLNALRFAAFEVRSMVLQLVSCEHPDAAVIAQLRKEYEQFPEGKDLAVTGVDVAGRILLVQGGFVQMRSIVFPMPLTGPYTPDKMSLTGDFDQEAMVKVMGGKAAEAVAARAQRGGGENKNVEKYVLTRVETKGATSTWTGACTMHCTYAPEADGKVVEMKTSFKVKQLVVFERDINDPDIHAALGAPRLMGEDDEEDGGAGGSGAGAGRGGAVLN